MIVVFALMLILPTTLTRPSCDPQDACCHCSLPAPSYSSPISPCPAHCISTVAGWPMSLPGLLPDSPHSPIAPTPSTPLDSVTPMNHAGAALMPIVAADARSPSLPSPLPVPLYEPQPDLPSTQALAVTPYPVVTREQSVTHSQTAPQSENAMPSFLSSTTTRATPRNYVNLTKTHIAKNLEEHDQAYLGDASLNAYGDVTYITVMGLNEPVQSVNYMLGLSWNITNIDLRWNPQDFGGVMEVPYDRTKLKLPTLSTCFGKVSVISIPDTFIVHHTGLIRAAVELEITASCPMEASHYASKNLNYAIVPEFSRMPYDFHTCQLCFSLSGLKGSFNVTMGRTEKLFERTPSEWTLFRNFTTWSSPDSTNANAGGKGFVLFTLGRHSDFWVNAFVCISVLSSIVAAIFTTCFLDQNGTLIGIVFSVTSFIFGMLITVSPKQRELTRINLGLVVLVSVTVLNAFVHAFVWLIENNRIEMEQRRKDRAAQILQQKRYELERADYRDLVAVSEVAVFGEEDPAETTRRHRGRTEHTRDVYQFAWGQIEDEERISRARQIAHARARCVGFTWAIFTSLAIILTISITFGLALYDRIVAESAANAAAAAALEAANVQ